MIRRPPRSTRTDTLFPCTTLFRSRIPEAPANLALIKGCSIVGVFWGAFVAREPEKNRANFAALLALYEQGRLKPHVSSTFALSEVPQAMQALLSRKTTGKVVKMGRAHV